MQNRRSAGDDLGQILRLIRALKEKVDAPELHELQSEIESLYGREVDAKVEAIGISEHPGRKFRVTVLTDTEPNFEDSYRLIRVTTPEMNPF